MSINPTFTRINGSGKPRILVIKDTSAYTSTTGTTYTATTATESGSPSLSAVRAGMRIRSYLTRGSLPALEVYARITSVNDTSDVITVSEWIGGTPTDAQAFVVDGYVIDLPYCQSLVETFAPDQLIHGLWRSRRSAIFYGWKYACLLDYAQWIAADTLIDMFQALNLSGADRIVLIPRVDKPGNQYNVLYDGSVSISRFGLSPGHRGVTFTFAGKENVPWPIPQSGYGFGYGYLYGTQL